VPASTPIAGPHPVESGPGVPPLLARGVERRFGALRVLRGVDLALAPGRLQLVLGPNGAGKTTLLRVLAGLTRATAGEVLVFGESPRGPAVRRRLGVLSHQSHLYDDLTPVENLAFAAKLYGLSEPDARSRDALRTVGLEQGADTPVRRLSRGTVQRAAIARALLHRPEVLLLDEPLTGLDPLAVGRIVGLLSAQLAAGTAVLLVTHSIAEVWSLADRVSVLGNGRWVIDEPRQGAWEDFTARLRASLDG